MSQLGVVMMITASTVWHRQISVTTAFKLFAAAIFFGFLGGGGFDSLVLSSCLAAAFQS